MSAVSIVIKKNDNENMGTKTDWNQYDMVYFLGIMQTMKNFTFTVNIIKYGIIGLLLFTRFVVE